MARPVGQSMKGRRARVVAARSTDVFSAKVFVVMLSTLVVLPWLAAEGPPPGEPEPSDPVLLVPGRVIERRAEAGASHRYELPTSTGLMRLTAAQEGADVALTLYDAAGETLARVDDVPGYYSAAEILVVETSVTDPPDRLEVGIESRGAYRLTLEIHPLFEGFADARAAGDDRLRRRLAADRFATTAATRRATEGEEGLRAALELYRKAGEQLAALGDVARQALMVERQAGLWTRLGETDRALAELDRAIELSRSAGDPAGEAAALLLRGVTHSRRGDDQRAADDARRAATLFEQLGSPCGEARAANNLGRLERGSRPAVAREHFEHALALCGGGREPELEGVLLLNIGSLHARLGELDRAIELSRRALPLLRALDRPWLVMRTLVNLGYYHRRLGELGRSFEDYAEALALAEHHGDRHLEGTVHNSLGYLYLVLGEGDNALGHLERSLALRREVEDRRGEAVTLANLARAHRLQGELELARRRLDESLAIRRRRDDRRGEARNLEALAEVALEADDPLTALGHLEAARALLTEVDDDDLKGELELTRGRALLAAGRPAEAVERLRTELERRNEAARPLGLARLLPVLARAERRVGRHLVALEHLAMARDQAESLRLQIGDPELRATFFGAVADLSEELIATHHALHRLEPRGPHAERAFEASEWGRARGLFELLAKAEAEMGLDADRQLVARRERLLREASQRTDQRRRLEKGSAEALRLDHEIAERVAALRGVEETLRRQSARWRALDPATLPTAREIRALLEPDTLLIEFALGEEKSVLFALGHDGLELHELPARESLERDARRLLEMWSVLDPYPETAVKIARRLSDRLLDPVAPLLAGRTRLLVVADGALHTLPFGALPMPGSERSLLEHFEVVSLPSASWLALRRRQVSEQLRAEGAGVAVLADPVFAAEDPRLVRPSEKEAGGDESGPVRTALRGTDPVRLPASRLEARMIAALAGDDTLLLLDTQARLEALFDGTLDGRRVLHLATHGVLDGRHPRLSGLELSRFDAAGRPVAGFLSLARLYDLRLDAELVVLSGCRTALGRTVSGEGIIGLPRGFLHAGARGVVASLWQVQDRATAELMQRFYRALLDDGETPSAALRRAQLALRSEPAYHDPFFWAAFVHIGDWR